MLETLPLLRPRNYLEDVSLKIYGIDLDGVCYDFIPRFSQYLKNYTGVQYDNSEITDYYWYKCIPGLKEDDFWEAFDAFGVTCQGYRNLPVIDGAKEGIRFLMENANDVWFITGRPHYAFEQTADALERDFGVNSDHIIFSSGKDYKSNVVNRLEIDVFIDDGPHYVRSLSKNTSAKVYLMRSAPYGFLVDDPDIIAVDTWKEFIDRETNSEDRYHSFG